MQAAVHPRPRHDRGLARALELLDPRAAQPGSGTLGCVDVRGWRRGLLGEGLLRRAREPVLQAVPVLREVQGLVHCGREAESLGASLGVLDGGHAHASTRRCPGAGIRHGVDLGTQGLLEGGRELRGFAVLPAGRSTVLPEERVLGHLQDRMRHGAGSERRQQVLGLQHSRPEELGPGCEGLALAVLLLALHAWRLRRPIAEGHL
mmetsp:Transcript_23716/g.80191  ORF Transcript_23716/g.80191 Transcript_23716/m.80191 type:complete len:205 (+) Transcript_23716:722-1336(+)